MVNRIAMKGALDSVTGCLFGLGCAGISFAIYDGNIIAGVFGSIALGFGVVLRVYRTIWNERGKNGPT